MSMESGEQVVIIEQVPIVSCSEHCLWWSPIPRRRDSVPLKPTHPCLTSKSMVAVISSVQLNSKHWLFSSARVWFRMRRNQVASFSHWCRGDHIQLELCRVPFPCDSPPDLQSQSFALLPALGGGVAFWGRLDQSWPLIPLPIVVHCTGLTLNGGARSVSQTVSASPLSSEGSAYFLLLFNA